MTVDRLIHIVKGYHQVTPVPEFAIEQHLGNRFAVIIDPFVSRPDAEESDFDVELMIAILSAVSAAVDHDTFLAETDEDTSCNSLSELCGTLRATSGDENQEAPRRIFYSKRGAHVCLEETEFWALCGGPAPYHDSYTLSFYTREDSAESFESACLVACQQVGGRVGNIIQASAVPIPRSFWNRVIRWLLGL